MVIGAGDASAEMAVVPINSSGSPPNMDRATGIIVRRFRIVPPVWFRFVGTYSASLHCSWTERSLLYLAAHVGGGRPLGIAEIAIDDLLACLRRRTEPADLSAHEDDTGICHGQGAVDELLGEHDRDARTARLFQSLEDGLRHDRRQTQRHLVRDDELRRDRECPGQGQHLLLPTREASRPLRPAL